MEKVNKPIVYQVDSAQVTSSHLRIAQEYHTFLRKRQTKAGLFLQYTAVNPQDRGIIYAHTIWHFRPDGTTVCKHVIWKKTRKGKLMGDVDTMWFICPNYSQIVDMTNAFHHKPKWNMN